jgi:hypothetical protein
MPRHAVRKKQTPFKPFETDPGAAYLYILTNPEFREVKIGFTERSPNERAKELSSATGVPSEFQVKHDWFVPADQVRALEAEIHKKLRHQGYHHKKEFFSIGVDAAVEFIEEVLGHHNLLDLSREKEEQRRYKLRKYYEDKAARAREIENAHRLAERERGINSELDKFRFHLELKLAERHPIRFKILPFMSALIGALLAILVAALTSAPWPYFLLACIGGGLLAYESVMPKISEFVARRYGAVMEERLKLARQVMEKSSSTPANFPASSEYKSLLLVDDPLPTHLV